LIQIVRSCAARPHFVRHIEALGANVTFVALIVPEIRHAFELPPQEPGRTTPDPEEARFKLFDSVTMLLRSFSRDDPLVLVVDDLQDADQSSLEMLRFIAHGVRESRILVLGTYRDAEVRSSADLQQLIGGLSREAVTILLGGLGKRELMQLVERRTGQPADEEFVEMLYQATDGNPLSADRAVRLLIAEREEADVFHRCERGESGGAVERVDAAIENYRYGGAGQRWTDYVAPARGQVGASSQSFPRTTFVSGAKRDRFCREGEYWTISYRDRLVRLKDVKGLQYIAYLLAHPREQVHVHDLVTAIEGVTVSDVQIDNLHGDGLEVASDLGNAGVVLDARARDGCRRRVAELRADLAEADEMHDSGRSERTREELDFLTRQLSAAFGLGGRERKSGDHAERLRSRVGKAIHASIRGLVAMYPALGHHFATCIHTGYLCAYLPDPETPLTWLL
jgi:hypothetical protein